MKHGQVKFDRPLHTMNETEFYAITRKGHRHLLILDGLVLDATDYAPYHPGGKFIIERCRGTDISKFFKGWVYHEPMHNGFNHLHSNYARMVVNSLIIGKLDRSVETALAQSAGSQTYSKFVPVPAQSQPAAGQYLAVPAQSQPAADQYLAVPAQSQPASGQYLAVPAQSQPASGQNEVVPTQIL